MRRLRGNKVKSVTANDLALIDSSTASLITSYFLSGVVVTQDSDVHCHEIGTILGVLCMPVV